MKVIYASNPDQALQSGLAALAEDHVYAESRNGPVLRFPTPVTTVWTNPLDRISLMPVRDANPFFHLVEAYWMLAGSNDVGTVANYASNMSAYSDDGHTLWGAYGYRWRVHFGIDQITLIIDELKKNRGTRRCVLQMWDGREELLRGRNGGKDLCCNTAVYFDPQGEYLNMTVTNRSNDMVYGAYGANVVHMSILLEYIAAQTGFKVGTYYQVSNNLHFYTELSPLMAKLATYKDGKLTVSEEVLGYERPQIDIETLFPGDCFDAVADDTVNFPMPKDSVFRGRVQRVLRGEELDRVDHYAGLWALSSAIESHHTYKTNGASEALELYDPDGWVLSSWQTAEMEWLKRRPSNRNG